jgi:hypothetical protein
MSMDRAAVGMIPSRSMNFSLAVYVQTDYGAHPVGTGDKAVGVRS